MSSLKKQVFIFRHGETDWNRERRLQGHSDIPLNALGRSQASRLALELKSVGIDLILSSDLGRALETARVAARETGAPILVLPKLRETCLGDAEGLTHDEVVTRFGEDAWKNWLSLHPDHDHFAFSGGESKFQLRQRLFEAMEEVLRKFPHERVAVSTHGGALRRILHRVDSSITDPATIPNCQIFNFIFDPPIAHWLYLPKDK